MQAARRIAAGDLQVPLEAAEGGEIGEMADALEQMRRSLLHNIQELARLSETLETRVKERTEALRRQEALAHRLLRRALAAQEEERRRISYELHDEIGQSLTALRLDLERLARSSTDRAAKERIAQAQEMVGRVVADLRRVIAALHPGVLDQLGLIPALQWVAERTLRPLGVEVAIQGQTEPRLPAETELVLFRVAQEAIHNIARHSGASRVEVTLQRESGSIVMIVHDNGRGFDPTAVVPDPDSGRGLGLAGMQERASLVGGHVRILSAPGEGATVEVHIPLSPAV
ncbi:MAG: sensor histidine kinase, partial [Chloroflexota bacterium]